MLIDRGRGQPATESGVVGTIDREDRQMAEGLTSLDRATNHDVVAPQPWSLPCEFVGKVRAKSLAVNVVTLSDSAELLHRALEGENAVADFSEQVGVRAGGRK